MTKELIKQYVRLIMEAPTDDGWGDDPEAAPGAKSTYLSPDDYNLPEYELSDIPKGSISLPAFIALVIGKLGVANYDQINDAVIAWRQSPLNSNVLDYHTEGLVGSERENHPKLWWRPFGVGKKRALFTLTPTGVDTASRSLIKAKAAVSKKKLTKRSATVGQNVLIPAKTVVLDISSINVNLSGDHLPLSLFVGVPWNTNPERWIQVDRFDGKWRPTWHQSSDTPQRYKNPNYGQEEAERQRWNDAFRETWKLPLEARQKWELENPKPPDPKLWADLPNDADVHVIASQYDYKEGKRNQKDIGSLNAVSKLIFRLPHDTQGTILGSLKVDMSPSITGFSHFSQRYGGSQTSAVVETIDKKRYVVKYTSLLKTT